jgi:hypothetical protein
MEVTRIADLPPELYEMAQLNRIELYFVNAFTKIDGTVPNGSGRSYQLSEVRVRPRSVRPCTFDS